MDKVGDAYANIAARAFKRVHARYCWAHATMRRRRANANISPTAFGQMPFTTRFCARKRCLHARLFFPSRFLSTSRCCVHLYFDTLSRAFIPLLTSHSHAVGEKFPLARNLELGYAQKTRASFFPLSPFLSLSALLLFLIRRESSRARPRRRPTHTRATHVCARAREVRRTWVGMREPAGRCAF